MSSSAPGAVLPAIEANSGDVSLRGFWLRALQALWVVFVLFDLATLVISYPAFFQALHTVCATSVQDCSVDQLTLQPFAALLRAGYSIDSYAFYTLVVDVLTTIPYLLVGFLIFWRRSNTWMGLYVSFFLINLGSLGASLAHVGVLPEHGSLLIEIVNIGSAFLGILYYPILAFFFFMFPDGRLVPRWSWALIGLWVINAFFWITPNEVLNIMDWHPLLRALWLAIVFGGSLATQVYRYWRVASPIQRQQIKWLFYGYTPVLVLTVFGSLFFAWVPELGGPDTLLRAVLTPLYRFYYFPVPICIGIALLRYRLWDVDALINRTLVYGSLTAILIGSYLLLVFAGQNLVVRFIGRSDGVVLVISTLVVAGLFQPLRHLMQRVVDRRFYRRKYNAKGIMTSFASTLHQEINLQQLNTHLLDVIEETMQPAHISLWLCPPLRPAPSEDQRSGALEPVIQKTGRL